MTAFCELLRRRLGLLLACLMIALAPRPPSDVVARDASAVSIGASAVLASVRAPERAAARHRRSMPLAPAAGLEPAARETKALASAARHADRRYLYLEISTLLS